MTRAPSLDVERLATAAAAFLVGIAERKAALQLFLDIIHLGAEDKHHRFRIDEDRDALVFDNLVELALLVGIFERVAEARTTARAHADTNARGRLAASGEEGLDPRRCSIRHRQDLPSRPHPSVLQTRISYHLYRPRLKPLCGDTAPRCQPACGGGQSIGGELDLGRRRKPPEPHAYRGI